MNNKKASKITVTVSTSSKSKNLHIVATVPGAKEAKCSAILQGKKKKGTFKVSVTKTPSLYVTNYGMSKVKVKVKISANSKILKIKKKQITTGDVG